MTDTVLTIIAGALDAEPDSITEESTIQSVPEWDSLSHLRIILALEDKLGAHFNTQTIPDMTTTRAIIAEIERQSQAAKPL